MQAKILYLRTFSIIVGVTLLVFSSWASADPPSRVARLGYMSGAVSFSPSGVSDWVQATVNRPLTTGDRLWAVAGARAEIQVSANMIHMNADTGISVLNLDDRIVQLQLTQGTLNIRVRRLEPRQVFEVDTPNLALVLRKPGQYHISVDPDGNATDIVVRQGQAEVYADAVSYAVDSRQPYRFYGTGLREYQLINAPSPDEFDRWASDRDRQYDNSISARYVSPDVIGYQDLDDTGIWRTDATYGKVWIPNDMAAGWGPYRDGHWAWVAPWGWTWVDDARWGFAVSHYGRWMHRWGTWCWVPGPARARAYYAPALVAFVGGNNVQIPTSGGSVNGIAWFALAPREVYRPAYPVSRRYFERINSSNTLITNKVINNTYNTTNVTHVVYANRQIPGAVIAVPTTAFVQSQPVSKSTVPVTLAASAPVALTPHVRPNEHSVRAVASRSDKPPAHVFDRPVVAHTAPPVAHTGFMAQRQQLNATPGKPLVDTTSKELIPVVSMPTPVVKVLTPSHIASKMPVPAPVSGAMPGEARGKPPQAQPTVVPTVPVASRPQEGASPQVVPAPPPIPPHQGVTPPVPGPRGRPEQHVKKDEPRTPLLIAPSPSRMPEVKTMGSPSGAPPVVAAPAPLHRPEPPKLVPLPQVPPFVPTPRPAQPSAQPVKPDAAPMTKHVEPMQPVATPKPPPQRVHETPSATSIVLPALSLPEAISQHSPPAIPSLPKSEPHVQGPMPKPGQPLDHKNDDAHKREEEAHKRKGGVSENGK